MSADFDVSLEVRPGGFTKGAREAATATRELTERTRESGAASRTAATAEERLAEAERRRMQAAAEVVRSYKQRITALAEYQRQLAAGSTSGAALTRDRISSTGVAPDSRLGQAMQQLIEKEQRLKVAIRERAEETDRAQRVTANISSLQARTRAMQEALGAAQRGEDAERAYAEALEVRRHIEAVGARPGTDEAAQVEREVQAQQRLRAEMQAVAAARERDTAAAREAAAQRDRIDSEIAELREATQQLEVLAAAHRKDAKAVHEANLQLQIRNTLLRAGVAAGSADAATIEKEIRAQAALRQQIDQSTAAKRRSTEGVFNLRNAFFALQGALATLGLATLIRDAVNVALALDRAQKALVAVTGSQAGATREMAFVSAEADRLGLVLTDTAQAYAALAAASRGTALEGAATRDIFSAVAEASTVMGLSADQSAGALQAIQQMISKGTVQSEELRGQLGERLPGAFQIAARAMGVTTQELGKLLETGKVTAEELLPKLADELRKTFGPGLINAVNSAQANLNRFRNAVDQVKGALGEGFLEGFLAGFSDLRDAMTAEELKAAARDLGQTIGEGLRIAADAAALLAQNLDLVRTALIAILALQGAARILAIGAAMKLAATEAGAASVATYAWGRALAALPLAAVAIALGYLVSLMYDYISAQEQAWQAEMKRVEHSREIFEYYNVLKAKTEGLTAAERAYALEVRKTLSAQLTAARIELQKKRDFYSTAGRAGFYSDPKELAAAVERREEVIAARQEVENYTNELRVLNDEWARLGQLPAPKLEVEDEGLDKTGQKIADLLEGFRRAAEQAERVAQAAAVGPGEQRRVTDELERQNAAYQALDSIEGLSAETKRKLTAAIEGYVGRTQRATVETDRLAAARERDVAYSDAARESEARLADIREGGTRAARDLAAALEAEAIAREDGREGDGKYIDQLTAAIVVRNDYIASIEAEIAVHQRAQEWLQERAGMEAELRDLRTGSTAATREHAIWLEVERLRISEGVAAWEPRAAQLRQEVEERAAVRAEIERGIAAQRRKNDAEASARQVRAEFSDWQVQTEAALRYGSAIAGILQQHGMLSESTRRLALEERIRIAIIEETVGLGAEEAFLRSLWIRSEIEGYEEANRALEQHRLQTELAAHSLEPVREAWRSTGETIKDVLADALTGAEVSWKDLIQNMLRMWARAMIEMVTRWVAAQRAMAASQVAMNGAGGGGGGVNWMGAIKGLFGAGGGQYGWLSTSTAGMGQTGAAAATLDAAAMGGTGAAGASWAAVGGYFAAVAAVFLVVVNQMKTSGRALASAKITIDETGQVLSDATERSGRGSGRRMQEVTARIKAIGENMTAFVEALGGALTGLGGELELGRSGQGSNTNHFVRGINAEGVRIVRNFGKDAEAAMEFALVQALRQAEIKGITPLVQAALRQNATKSLAELQEYLKPILEIDELMRGSLSVAARQSTLHFDKLREALENLRLPIEQATEAAGAINLAEARWWIEGRRRLTGEEPDPQEEWNLRLREIEIFNAELALRRANIELKIQELEADIRLQETRQMILERNASMLERLTEFGIDLGAGLLSPEQIAAMRQQLDALRRMLGLLPEAIDPDQVQRNRRRGSGGTDVAGDRTRLREMLDEAARSRLPELDRQLAEINRRWDEAAKLAHGNAELLARVNDERRREIDLLIQQQARQTMRGVAEFLGWTGGALGGTLDAIQSQADGLINGLRALHRAGRLSTEALHGLAGAIRDAAEAAQESAVNTAANSLLMDLYSLLGEEDEAAKLRYELTVAELKIRREELFIALTRLGMELTVIGVIDDLLQRVEDIGPSIFQGGGGGAPDDGIIKPAFEISEVIRDAVRAFRDVVRDLIQAQRDLLLDDKLSPLPATERLALARQDLEALVARARTGDLDAWKALPDAQKTLLEIGREVFGAGQGYTELFNEIRALLSGLANDPATEQNVIQFAIRQAQQATESFASQNHRDLQDLRDALADLRAELVVIPAAGRFGTNAAPAPTTVAMGLASNSAPSATSSEVVVELRAIRTELALLRVQEADSSDKIALAMDNQAGSQKQVAADSLRRTNLTRMG